MQNDRHHDFAFMIQKAVLKRKQDQSATDVMAYWLAVYEQKVREAIMQTIEQFALDEEGASKRVVEVIGRKSLSTAMADLHLVRARVLRDVARMIAGQKKG